MKKELVDNILERIKDKHIKPKPKWIFAVRNFIIWALGFISFLLASLIFAVVLYFLVHNDWDLYRQLERSFVGFIFITLPYLWLLLMAATIGAAYYNIRHTKKGYRYPLYKLALISMAAVVLVGGLFYGAGAGEEIDDRLSASMPIYTRYFNNRVYLWTNPEQGMLAGRVTKIMTPEQFELLDIRLNTWQIQVVSNPKFVPMFEIREGNKVKVIGKIIAERKFQAERVMPFGPGREVFQRLHMMRPLLEQHIPLHFPIEK